MKIKEKSKKFEERFGTLFETAGDPILILDKKGRLVSINHKVTEKTGFTKKELIGKHFVKTKLLTPKSMLVCLKNFAKRMLGKDIPPYEIEVLTKRGDMIFAEINANPIKEKGEIVGDLVIFRDITERKKTEEELRENEKKFKDLVETTPDWVWEVDKEGIYSYVNPKVKDLLGYEVSEVLGKTPFDLMPKEEAVKISKFFSEKVTKKEPFYGLENINRHKDGHLVILETSGVPIFDDKGQFKGYRGIDRDITERKKAEAEIKKNKDFIETVLNSINDPFYVINLDYTIALANRVARERGIFEGGYCYRLTHKKEKPCEDGHLCPLREVLRTGKSAHFEHVHYDNKGNARVVEVYGDPAYGPDGKVVQMVEYTRDITERKELEKQRLESNNRLQRLAQKLTIARDELKVAVETKGEFMNIAAHELRTPLQPIIGYADRLLQERNPTDWQKERLNIILDNAKRLLKLVQDLLDINKMETGIMKFTMAEVDLLAIIKEIYQSFKPTVEAKKLKFILDISETPSPIKVKGDPNRLNQVFSNLLDNAIKFTDKGTITIQVKEGKNTATVSFKDTGSGIAKKYIPQLFTKFFQADATDKRKVGGTGLGLAICKEIVKAHKGKISVQSTLGKGSTFRVILPKLTRPTKRKGVENGQNFGSRR